MLLLAAGASVSHLDLKAAIDGGYVDVVDCLLEAGGDPRWVLSGGKSVLEEARGISLENRAKMVATIQRFLASPSR
jgi:hypothetical protein